MIKAVFFDIDGTLVSFKTHVVPKSTLHAIELLKKKGIKVFIATGRHRRSINNLGDLEFDGYVTLNGGYVFAGKDDVIYKHSIPDKDIESLVRYQEMEGEFPCAFVQEEEIFMNYTDKAVNDVFHLLNFPAPPIRPIEDIYGKTVYQLIAFLRQSRKSELCKSCPIVNPRGGILFLRISYRLEAVNGSGLTRCWNISISVWTNAWPLAMAEMISRCLAMSGSELPWAMLPKR